MNAATRVCARYASLRSLAIVGFAGCSFATGAWAQTASKPARSLPLVANGEPVDLAGISGVRVLKNGAILYGDSKPVTLNVAQARDGHVKQIGRAGAGPGEYKTAPTLVGYRGDSVVAYDAALERWSLLSPSGAFVRLLGNGSTVAAFPQQAAWVADGGAIIFNAAIDGIREPVRESVRLVIAQMNGNARVIRQALNGDLWAAPAFVSSNWTVFDRAGLKRTSFKFATPFRFEFANDTIAVGETTDSDDAPQILVQPLRTIPASNAKVATAAVSNVTTDDRKAAETTLKSFLRKMVGSQEGAYSRNNSYTSDVATLKVEIPSGVKVHIVDAHKRGWWGVATDERTQVACAMGVGFSVIGWAEGTPHCSK